MFVSQKCKILRTGVAKIMPDKFSIHKITVYTKIRND